MNTPAYANVALVGFMGSGKSSVGRLIARSLGGRFVDTDRLVVDHAGCEITEIFATRGEAYFRSVESGVLRALLGEAGLVVATGGGIVTVAENAGALTELGYVVWLDASEEVIWERVSRNSNRPLLHTENPRETMRRLLEARNPMYQAVANLRVDTSTLTHAEVAEIVCREMRAAGK